MLEFFKLFIKPKNDELGRSLGITHIDVTHIPITHIVDVKSTRKKPNGQSYKMSELRLLNKGLGLNV